MRYERKAMTKDTQEYVKDISKVLRKNQTYAEALLWERLRGKKLGPKFRRQYCIGRYIADFYCSEARLVIEVDGKVHEGAYRKEYDAIREKEIAARDIKALRFSNEKVINDIDGVIALIYNEVNTAE